MKKTILATLTAAALAAGGAMGQIVFEDDFTTSQGATFTTSGNIGTSPWTVTRSGDDWGARIDGGILALTNDASAAGNANGWVFANVDASTFGGFYDPTLSNSGGLVTWTLNMRQIRSNPAGFSSNSYGVAFVIGATSQTVATAGNGYAIVLGNTGTPDPIRFVSFAGGIQSLGTTTGGLITATAPLNDPTTDYMSLQLTYDPATNFWELFGRNDGATSFTDPLSGTLTSLGSVTDSTYTGVALNFMGAYWQGSTAGNQTAFFDNVTVTAVPEPHEYALGFGALLLAVVLMRRRRSGVVA